MKVFIDCVTKLNMHGTKLRQYDKSISIIILFYKKKLAD